MDERIRSERFRFRVWDNKENRYGLPVFTHAPDDEDGRANLCCELVPPASDDPDRFVIEQCTGMHDSTGKLIYEGDVVVGVLGTEWPRYIVWKKGQFKTQTRHGSYALQPPEVLTVKGDVHTWKGKNTWTTK